MRRDSTTSLRYLVPKRVGGLKRIAGVTNRDGLLAMIGLELKSPVPRSRMFIACGRCTISSCRSMGQPGRSWWRTAAKSEGSNTPHCPDQWFDVPPKYRSLQLSIAFQVFRPVSWPL